MTKIISLICVLFPILAFADAPQVLENAPDRHVVVKGDTLWDISATFFKDPWKWQQIWGLNKDTIKDPHWIYPGDVVILDRTNGTLHFGQTIATSDVSASDNLSSSQPPVSDSTPNVVKLSPRAREVGGYHDSIPTIPFDAIAPFLTKPLVVDDAEILGAPKLVGTYEQRVLLGTNDIAYVSNMPVDKGVQWQVYRLGKTFVDPDSKQVLGHEVSYLGDAAVEKFAPISELRITKSISEIGKGDYFSQTTVANANFFEPQATSTSIVSKVISIYGGVSQAGTNAVITINKGRRDGIENGHVLALYQQGEVLKGGTFFKSNNIILPNVRYGLIFVFRTFEKVSFALVLQTRLPVQLLDSAQTP